MAEGTYEYECMRAELLGIEKPDYETFVKNRKEEIAVESEEIETENLKVNSTRFNLNLIFLDIRSKRKKRKKN